MDKELRLILEEWNMIHLGNTGWTENNVNKLISQIKALVIESLGEKEEVDVGDISNGSPTLHNIGYNQHILEMKEKWK